MDKMDLQVVNNKTIKMMKMIRIMSLSQTNLKESYNSYKMEGRLYTYPTKVNLKANPATNTTSKGRS